jgi:hypothetical protein
LSLKAEPVAAQHGLHAATAVVPADDDVAHLQNIHGELHGGQAVQVGMNDEIGDVPVNEQLAGQQTDNLISRHPAVRAADPQELRRLLPRKLLKKLRVLLPDAFGPGLVVDEKVAEGSHEKWRES